MTIATVVLCTRNRSGFLDASLTSIAASIERSPRVDVVIVQQGNGDAKQACRRAGLGAEVVYDPGKGASRARNIGIANTQGEIVLFTDDDCEVPVTWVSDHLVALKDPSVNASFGAVTGLSRTGDESDDPVALPGSHRRGALPWHIGHSSNMAIKRTQLAELGGFDERLGPGTPGEFIGEDADLIVRLLRTEATVISGVGTPVRHMEWRSEEDHRRVLRAYERGAGAWIGKAIREEGWPALVYLKQRFDLVRGRLRDDSGRRGPTDAVMTFAALARGVARGLRMPPWAPQ